MLYPPLGDRVYYLSRYLIHIPLPPGDLKWRQIRIRR